MATTRVAGLVAALTTSLILTTVTVVGHAPAEAAAPLPVSRSLYMRNQTTSTAVNHGCTMGSAVQGAGFIQVNAVLLFGAPRQVSSVAGTTNWNYADYTKTEIQSLSYAFAAGFVYCAGSNDAARLNLAVATSNDSNTYTKAWHGTEWGDMVDALQQDFNVSNWSNPVSAFVSSDIEPSFWASVANTRAWYDAAMAASLQDWMPNNSMDGCPTTGPYTAGTDCNAPKSGSPKWAIEDVYYVSGRRVSGAQTYAAPQIYFDSMASKMYWLSRYGVSAHGKKIYFKATMSTISACAQFPEPFCDGNLGPHAGYDALQNRINSYSGTSYLISGATNVAWADAPY